MAQLADEPTHDPDPDPDPDPGSHDVDTARPRRHHASGRRGTDDAAFRHEELYASPPPWDTGLPQPAFLALADAGLLHGRVLDVGCGTGEHTLMAARFGLEATGVDLATNALDLAVKKAEVRGLTARFVRHDALRLADLGERFDVVLDSLVFHGFRDKDRAAYTASLRTATKSGGRYFMLCFRDEPPNPSGRTHRLTPEEIRTAFADGWRIDAVEPVTIACTLPAHSDGIRGWRTALTRN
ncbi:class I SAM-dependent methyltransferase [Streptomyces spinosisporus]|uniref:Class I SAM-dependent methyltransferase n=1 Tax=Streptomyces spinosisporus TaxID=2927582 RepID=A0ABS9XS89_9ACTN|nr:class I SAM-dependent methyltransferase [Streptomyces spinosisporus]MCI3244948.1 class I SAM-dependent methyltransferase [Streptomyces spinosisporus]